MHIIAANPCNVMRYLLTNTGRASALQLSPAKESFMKIARGGAQQSGKGPAEWFTGTVRLDPLFSPPDPGRVAGALVTFEPGARSTLGHGADAVSVSIADVAPKDWAEKVYRPEIADNPEQLYKKPGYNPLRSTSPRGP
jgi:hypothetical protein